MASRRVASQYMGGKAVPNPDRLYLKTASFVDNKETQMSEATAAIEFDRESRARFEFLLGARAAVTGAHCGDDDEETCSCSGGIALGVHCGDDDDEPV
ncbi:MAG: hypothetical protein L0H63_04300 [Nitrococcus sp.]|nr:hypothetical protein [Nitrococcus sp.]